MPPQGRRRDADTAFTTRGRSYAEAQAAAERRQGASRSPHGELDFWLDCLVIV